MCDKGVFIGILSKIPRTSFSFYDLLQKNFAVIIHQSSLRVGVSRHAMDLEDGVMTQRAPKKTSNYFLSHYTTTNVDFSGGKDG